MRKLWFNQTGEEEVYEEELLAQIPKGDRLDVFDPQGGFKYSHKFGFDDLPDEVRWNEEAEHCEFINTERERAMNNQNFVQTQEEIDKLNKKLDLLDDLAVEEDCV